MDRQRTGVIYLQNGIRPVECTLHRVSAAVGHVKVPSSASIPQHFELNDGTTQRPATVVWRKGSSLGVRFDDYFRSR
jgi:hypothetical protein